MEGLPFADQALADEVAATGMGGGINAAIEHAPRFGPPTVEHQTVNMLAAQANLARRARLVAASATPTVEGFASRPALVVRRLLRREAST